MGIVTAVIALAIAGTLTWKRKLPKIVSLLTLVAGSGLTAGFLGRMLYRGAHWAAGLTGTATSAAFGVAVPSVLAIVAAIIYVHDVWPGHKASRFTTPTIGLLLPALVSYMGGAAGSLAGSGVHMLGIGFGHLIDAIFGGA